MRKTKRKRARKVQLSETQRKAAPSAVTDDNATNIMTLKSG